MPCWLGQNNTKTKQKTKQASNPSQKAHADVALGSWSLLEELFSLYKVNHKLNTHEAEIEFHIGFVEEVIYFNLHLHVLDFLHGKWKPSMFMQSICKLIALFVILWI